MLVPPVLVERDSVSDTGFRSGVEMRLKVITILVSVLKSLHIPFQIIGGDEPEDRDTIIRIGLNSMPAFYTITNDGISYDFMDSEGSRFTLRLSCRPLMRWLVSMFRSRNEEFIVMDDGERFQVMVVRCDNQVSESDQLRSSARERSDPGDRRDVQSIPVTFLRLNWR